MIREEGLQHSQVMTYATQLMDGIGPRLTGSPNLDKAITWAEKILNSACCVNVRTESWGKFGMSWQERNVWIRMTRPDTSPLMARATPWSPPTRGPVTGEVVAIKGFSNEKDFEPFRGKLRGKIVLFISAPSAPVVTPVDKPLFERWSEAQLNEFAAPHTSQPTSEPNLEPIRLYFERMERAGRFFAAEGVAAVLVPSGNNAQGGVSGGTIYVDTNYTFGWFVYKREKAIQVPLLVLAVEHYGRLSRLIQSGVPVHAEINVDTRLGSVDKEASNLFADIPGVDPLHKHELVMLTAHLDSWAAGTGATDDGAGVVIAMEAMRILKAVGVQPARTIRLALWTGEEQGSLGARAYVHQHLADLRVSQVSNQMGLPDFLRSLAGPMQPKPDHMRISAAYTLDAGGGKIRGISTGDPALMPLFQRWLEPLRDLGATMVTGRGDCGGDCAIFDHVGIPTPSFKQDPLDYDSRTHHTNADLYEHLVPDDLKQAAVVVATLIFETAVHDEMLPRHK